MIKWLLGYPSSSVQMYHDCLSAGAPLHTAGAPSFFFFSPLPLKHLESVTTCRQLPSVITNGSQTCAFIWAAFVGVPLDHMQGNN